MLRLRVTPNGRWRTSAGAEEVASGLGRHERAASREVRDGVWHGRHGIFGGRLNTAHAWVHGHGAVAALKGLFELRLLAHAVHLVWRRRRFGQAFLRHGAKVVGAALHDQGALHGEGRQAADSVAVLCGLLQLASEDAALQGEGIEWGEFRRRLAGNVHARRAQGPR